MKQISLILIFAIATTTTSSCTQDEENEASSREIRLSTSIVTPVLNRTADSGLSSWFAKDDKIGFSLWTAENETLTAFHENVPFVCTTAGSETTNAAFATQETPILWPEGNEPCTLFAYYPYQETSPVVNDKATVEVSTQQQTGNNYSQSDFLTAQIDGQLPQAGTVYLNFLHRLSKVNFILKNGKDINKPEDLLPATVIVTGMNTHGIINLSTPITVSGQSTVAEITPAGSFTKTTYKTVPCLSGVKALVIPQTVAEGTVLFKLTINGKEYTYQANAGNAPTPTNVFESGTSYNFIFTLKKGAAGADELDVSCGIGKWNEAEDIEVDLEEKV
ncbi:fimbrillin family protein [Bacteroides sp.]|uniref:fimbrillin family protein n=1 Tax=Bacteroides sp. TaxID=29523 RepID=UPI002627F2BD|nr:fimbrillin family protein [Bacteroides sp.]MDD3038681.1 fimbrillin family protein [Bacteroides sp.]